MSTDVGCLGRFISNVDSGNIGKYMFLKRAEVQVLLSQNLLLTCMRCSPFHGIKGFSSTWIGNFCVANQIQNPEWRDA